MAANWQPIKVQNGTKITRFWMLHSAEKPSFISWLD